MTRTQARIQTQRQPETRTRAESIEAIIIPLWERNYDRLTTRIIEGLPLEPTWNCLDVGAGAGSMAFWLAERVPRGSVIAVDTDISLMDADRASNLIVEQADITVKGPDEPESLDFILIRAVLSLLSDPQELIAHAVSWLRPGGWLLAEDFYFMPAADSPTENGRTVVGAYTKAMELGGANPRFGRSLPHLLPTAGLTSVETNVRPLGPGTGEAENALMRARMELQGQPLVDNGLLTAEEIADFIDSIERPEGRDVTALLFSVWGRRPRA